MVPSGWVDDGGRGEVVPVSMDAHVKRGEGLEVHDLGQWSALACCLRVLMTYERIEIVYLFITTLTNCSLVLISYHISAL